MSILLLTSWIAISIAGSTPAEDQPLALTVIEQNPIRYSGMRSVWMPFDASYECVVMGDNSESWTVGDNTDCAVTLFASSPSKGNVTVLSVPVCKWHSSHNVVLMFESIFNVRISSVGGESVECVNDVIWTYSWHKVTKNRTKHSGISIMQSSHQSHVIISTSKFHHNTATCKPSSAI